MLINPENKDNYISINIVKKRLINISGVVNYKWSQIN